jgi:hypothetical protein
MVLGWIEEDGNWTEITGQIPFSTASADSLTQSIVETGSLYKPHLGGYCLKPPLWSGVIDFD